MKQAVATIEGLSRSEMLDLLDLLPPGSVEERTDDLPPGELGEPVTAILLIAITIATLTAISTWLASRGKDVELSISLEAPGLKGSVSLKARGGDTPEALADQVRQHGIALPLS